MNKKEQLSEAIATVERQISEAKSEVAKKTLSKKLERLKEELKAEKSSGESALKTLTKARKTVKALPKTDFEKLVEKLSEKPEYAFLKDYSKDRLRRDAVRTAKPKGYRFVGDNNAKPTIAQIKKGLKDGTVYYEGRPIRSDVNSQVRLAQGGHVSKGKMVWNQMLKEDKLKFMQENFGYKMTPEEIEAVYYKKYDFLPKNVKIVIESKTANLEEYADGGLIVDKYEGKTAEQVWNGWNLEQRKHFLKDHLVLSGKTEDHRASLYKYDELPADLLSKIKPRLTEHINEGKYAKGGNIEFRSLAKSNNFDIIVPEGRFEVELDSNKKVKSIVHPSGETHQANECPIYQKYKKEIKEYLTERFEKGGSVLGRGWEGATKGERITDIADFKVGKVYLSYNPQFNAKNLIRITSKDDTGLNRPLVYATFVRNKGNEGSFAIWDYQLEDEEYYKSKEEKYEDGGRIDLFEDYENIPPRVQVILDKYSEDFEDGNYEGMGKALEEIEAEGYTFDFYVDGSAYGLRPKGVKLSELEGYEDEGSDSFATGGEIDSSKVGVAKRLKVKSWYTKTYPTDDLGKEINAEITFWQLYTYLFQGYDVYKVLGVGDSLVRERVFEKLSEIIDVDYEVIYNKWLKSENKYKEGGSVGSYTYLPNEKIEKIVLKSKQVIGKDRILDGAYIKEKLLKGSKSSKATKISKSAEEVYNDLIKYVKENFKEKKFGKDKDYYFTEAMIQQLIDAKYSELEIRGILFGINNMIEVDSDNELYDLAGIQSYGDDYKQKYIDWAVEASKKNAYELGLTYPQFDWKRIVAKYEINLKPIEIIRKREFSSGKYDNYVLICYVGKNIVIGGTSKRERYENGKLHEVIEERNPSEINGQFNGGYWGIVSSKKEVIKDVAEMLLSQKEGYVKDVDFITNNLGGLESKDLIKNNIKFAKGGNISNESKNLSSMTGASAEAIENFFNQVGLDHTGRLKVTMGVGRGHLSRKDFATAIAGEKGNKYANEIIDYAQSDRAFKMAKGGNLGYAYVPNEDISKIIATDGTEYGENVILDGAYVTDKVRTPKMSRTQFEDDTYSFGNGGKITSSTINTLKNYVFEYNYPKFKGRPEITTKRKIDTSKVIPVGGMGIDGFRLITIDGDRTDTVITLKEALEAIRKGETRFELVKDYFVKIRALKDNKMSTGGNLGKSLYVANSSFFDYNTYDTKLITAVLKAIGAKNIHLESESPNLPEVVVFNGDKSQAREALNSAFDTESILVYEKDWRKSKYEEGGNLGEMRFDLYGYKNLNDRVQEIDEIIHVDSYEEAEAQAKQKLAKHNLALVELGRKNEFVGSVRPNEEFIYSSRYKKEMAQGGNMDEFEDKIFWVMTEKDNDKNIVGYRVMRGDFMTRNSYKSKEEATEKARELNAKAKYALGGEITPEEKEQALKNYPTLNF